MLTRRKLIMGAVATALVGLGATPALARDERLLADILYGVSDALVRDYIRDRYEDGRWDGHYWYYGGHRFRQSLLWHRRNSKAAPVAIKKAIKTGKKRAPNSDDCSGLLVLNPTREFYSIALLSFKSFWHLFA